jgi:hypothetical protein
MKNAHFIWKNGNQKISLSLNQYISEDAVHENYNFHSEDVGAEELYVNDRLMIINNDKKRCTVLFRVNNTVYYVETFAIQRDTLMAILYSFN